jgi:23S rRNA (adenine2503-C2)-methyltransferase
VKIAIPHPLGLTSRAFAEAFPRVRGGSGAAYRAIFRDGAIGFTSEGTAIAMPVPSVTREQRTPSDEGEVLKFILSVAGSSREPSRALETESVLIPMIGRTREKTHSLCVSSQVGCAMGCVFCETAQMGLVRSLEAWEIVSQWWVAAHALRRPPQNIVFMGMGEPMDNLEGVLRAIEVLTDHRGAAMPMSRIVVSTVGRLDGIRTLAERVRTPGWHRLNLAVSVNAPNDEVRSRLMPINRAMPMRELREALGAWPLFGGAKICIEYVLIPGVNDEEQHAKELAAWVRGLPACVNVIPYNPRRASPWEAPSEERVTQFLAWLLENDTYCKRRRTKGRDVMGACGQLGNPEIRQRRFVPLGVSEA